MVERQTLNLVVVGSSPTMGRSDKIQAQYKFRPYIEWIYSNISNFKKI